MDPLSDVLSLLKPQSYISGGFEVAGDMAIQFPKHPGIKCYAVVSGQCWLSVEGVPDAVLLTAGDCFLLPRGLPFCLATDLSLTPVDFHTFLPAKRKASTVSRNGRWGSLCCRRPLRPYRQSCRNSAEVSAAHRAYPERVG